MQCCIIWVFKPTLDEDSIVRLQREILCHVVHNDGFVEWSTNAAKIFDEDHAGWAGVLTVKAIRNVSGLVY